jgi:S-DNA-T family DNA segregation ATPase FtsK/SpoIIIE
MHPPPPVLGGEIVVDPPPEVPRDAETGLAVRLLPVAMLVAMGGMTAVYVSSGAASSRGPLFMFLPVMMLVSVLGSVIHQSRGARRGNELDDDRRRYLRQLDELDIELARIAVHQHASRQWSHPRPESLWTLIGGERMWERRPGDDDFCQVRIGVGRGALSATLVVPDLGPAESRDPVTADAVAELVARRATVSDLPIVVDLQGYARIVVEGARDAARGLVRAMVCQLAVLHGPGVVTVANGAVAEWDWLKWLPHRRDATGTRRVVIVDGDGDVSAGDGVTVVMIGRTWAGDCLRIDADAGHVDSLTAPQALACARRLAAHAPTAVGDPTSWADLVGIDDPTRVSWAQRPERRRLRVAIGTVDGGGPVELDLKEAARGGMGPHGLCIGATGSGKSEFLRTLALGLVATHGPDELNLVLVDFKGGATFLGFEGLRHVAAVVTNLSEEAHLVARMQDALAGEMTRRQRLLRAAGHLPNVSAYEAARAGGADLEPLPALFIIVDEFSELLSQQTDFAELFVAIGRLGRSLGMHLLLASQRLEEGRLRGLETHLSYRICLKTFSAQESRAVLGTTDAHELPATPGAALLKTAAGELVRFRTAFVSGPLDVAAPSHGAVPSLFTGRDVGPRIVGTRALIDVVLDGLAGRGRAAHRVWLPPLGDSPRLDSLLAATGATTPLVVPIGLVDNPFGQRRETMTVDLRGAGGNVAVVGGPRSGKSTAVHSLVLGLAAVHQPAALHAYVLDFGGGSLSSLDRLPQVGAVAGRTDQELARRIVAHVQGLVREREARRRRGADHGNAETFLVVDGWAVVREELDGMAESITAIAAQGLSYGVHVVITASRWADIRPALKDQLTTRVELCLGDPSDSEMDRKRARLLGVRPPGHGITREGLECVIALPAGGGMAAMHVEVAAPPVRLLPSHVPYDEVVARCPEAMVIGLEGDELAPMPMNFAHLLVLGDAECGKTATLRVVCREIVRAHPPDEARVLVVDVRRTLLGVLESDHLLGYAMSAASVESHVANAVDLLTARLPGDRVTQQQLRDRSWWTGPDVYVVVDDYDLVAGTSGNPLLPLLDLLPHSRDVGLHLVVARRSGGAARAMFDPILARLRELGCAGLMMSASPDEGVLLGAVRPGPLPAGRGTLVRRSLPDRLVQVSWTVPP